MEYFASVPEKFLFVFNILQTSSGRGSTSCRLSVVRCQCNQGLFPWTTTSRIYVFPTATLVWRKANSEERKAREQPPMPAERLQKIIAAAGIASRRKAEELITSGLVSVNGQTVTALGSKADPEVDHIKINGKPLLGPERHVYLLLHKPKGYVTTVTDPEGRPTVLDLVRGVSARIYPVGRLDYLSEGLLLLTNDGDLAQKLMHASSHVPKTYLVKISGKASDAEIDKLRGGLRLPPERSPLKATPPHAKAARGGDPEVPAGKLRDVAQRR